MGAAATAGSASAARSTCRRAGPTAATEAAAATSCSSRTRGCATCRASAGRRPITAERGGNGRGTRKHGADGADVELRVPVGTQIFEGGGSVADLAHAGARAVVAHGGLGGRGNARFATPTRQAPRFAETGLGGETRELELRLKLLADAALAGLPNAGKSSLLRRISNARPKVADYPFTTIAPVLGTVDGPDGRQLTVADVPGLIEGASEGIGLGHAFLAHLERARLLVHVIDASEGDADDRFATIDRELALYGAGLEERPQLVVLNKADLLPEPAPFSVADERIVGVVRVSCVTGAGIDELRQALYRHCPEAPRRQEAPAELAEFLEYRPEPPRRRPFRVLRTDRGFRVVGDVPARRGARSRAPRCGCSSRRGGRDRRRGVRCGSEPRCLRRHVRPATRRATWHWHGRVWRGSRSTGSSSGWWLTPGHRTVETPAEIRLRLAALAFADVPGAEVALDPYARTVDSLEALALDDPVFLVGADEFASFLDVEGSRARPGAGSARCGHAARVSARSSRCGARGSLPARSGGALRDRAVTLSPPRRFAASWLRASRSTASYRLPWRAEVERLGLYRGSSNEPEAG